VRTVNKLNEKKTKLGASKERMSKEERKKFVK
jgi:hypothetical protein